MDKMQLFAAGADFDEPPWLYIAAVARFPGDTAKRVEYLQAMKAEGLRRQIAVTGDAGEFPADFLWDILNQSSKFNALDEEAAAPATRGVNGVSWPLHGGHLAALTLLIPLVIWRKKGRPVGRGEAYRVLRRLIGAGVSERTLQANWMKYRSVAHIWAAVHLRPHLVGKAAGLGEFIGFAQQLRTEAGAYVPLRDREPLLPLDVSVNLNLIDLGGMATPGCPDWIDRIELPPEMFKEMGASTERGDCRALSRSD